MNNLFFLEVRGEEEKIEYENEKSSQQAAICSKLHHPFWLCFWFRFWEAWILVIFIEKTCFGLTALITSFFSAPSLDQKRNKISILLCRSNKPLPMQQFNFCEQLKTLKLSSKFLTQFYVWLKSRFLKFICLFVKLTPNVYIFAGFI